MRTYSFIVLAALVLNLAFSAVMGLRDPMESDAFYYQQIALSLADGDGFRFREGFWPDAPTMSRMPGWPALVALALRWLPGPPDLLMRGLALGINVLCALAVAALARRVTGSWTAACLGGLVYALHPTALSCAHEGLSEPLFVLLAVGGVLLLLRERPLPVLAGSLLLGGAVLVRANFLLLAFFVGALLALRVLRRRGRGLTLRPIVLAAAGALVFGAPAVGWALRNQGVCGHFPVLSTLRGQTFYGGNNAVVAGTLKYWGYWIFPNSVPGETPMVELSRTRSEYEVDVYYTAKGNAFLKANPAQSVTLMLGKLVRGYVPVPWVWRPTGMALAGFRLLLYAATLIGLWRWWGRTPPMYRLLFVAMALTSLATTLLFYGSARFTFALEPFMIPLAVASWRRKRQAS